MRISPATLVVVITVVLSSSVDALGCPRCFGFDQRKLVASCQAICQHPKFGFPSGKARTACLKNCETFINGDRCCAPTCLAATNTCLKPSSISKRDTVALMASRDQLEKVKRNPASLDMPTLLAREPPYDIIETTADLQALNPRAFETWQVDTGLSKPEAGTLVERANPQICCNLARIMVTAGVTALAGSMGNDDSDQQYAAMLAITIGWAASSACARYYAIICNP